MWDWVSDLLWSKHITTHGWNTITFKCQLSRISCFQTLCFTIYSCVYFRSNKVLKLTNSLSMTHTGIHLSIKRQHTNCCKHLDGIIDKLVNKCYLSFVMRSLAAVFRTEVVNTLSISLLIQSLSCYWEPNEVAFARLGVQYLSRLVQKWCVAQKVWSCPKEGGGAKKVYTYKEGA